MKKKILNVLLVLVMVVSFSLVTAVASFTLITAVPATPAIATSTPTTYYVATTGNNTSGSGSITAPWKTITYAISQVSADDTIMVAAGTYNAASGETFPITVDKALTIESVSGAENTNITNSSGLVLSIAAARVTVGGTNAGFRILGAGGGPAVYSASGIYLSTADGVTIQGNTFRSVAAGESVGIVANCVAQNDCLIDSNIFYGDAVWTTNSVEGGASTAIQIGGTTGTGTALTVSNNLAYNLKYTFLTLCQLDLGGDLDAAVVVTGNEDYNGYKYGVDIQDIDVAVSLDIFNNKFHGNGAGISIDSGATGIANITIQYNDIYANTRSYNPISTAPNKAQPNMGICNATGTTVNAQYNWWGDASGPAASVTYFDVTYSSGNDRGTGDALTPNVDFEPWLTVTQATAYGSGIEYFGYNLCYLVPGWNAWSTPIALDAQCDLWGTYRTLGTDLALADGANAFFYNAASQTWASVTDSYALSACDAIYINMASAQTSFILFSPTLNAPAKRVYAGWNLVSASYFDDVYDPDICEGVAVDTALASIYYVVGDNNIGYSMVVSPAIGDQDTWTFVRGDSIESHRTDVYMDPTKGYWVFMVNPGTLAGTVFTPVSNERI